ncbi:hypothetical protein [Salsipaludibacter albus]|uniref:hypothetical protein n=1 Tax=Salsipaludibacter albus TaxID=2849650 RepID=UPI001EE3BD50|nr:hypothetical protein [Salsipaludibacter albus]MBY5162957.1 hypothetical protein [Salsipaludibacter albus]
MPHEPSSEHDPAVLARGPLDTVDAHVLTTLRHAAETLDPVPPGLVGRITFAVALDEVYAEVAEIQREDLLAGSGVRGGDAADTDTATMTFSSERTSMTITVSPSGHRLVRIDGWLTGADDAVIALRIPGETRRAAAERGRFWFDEVPRGQVQLLVEEPDGRATMITPAVEL